MPARKAFLKSLEEDHPDLWKKLKDDIEVRVDPCDIFVLEIYLKGKSYSSDEIKLLADAWKAFANAAWIGSQNKIEIIRSRRMGGPITWFGTIEE
jgi:hypothetical protein